MRKKVLPSAAPKHRGFGDPKKSIVSRLKIGGVRYFFHRKPLQFSARFASTSEGSAVSSEEFAPDFSGARRIFRKE